MSKFNCFLSVYLVQRCAHMVCTQDSQTFTWTWSSGWPLLILPQEWHFFKVHLFYHGDRQLFGNVYALGSPKKIFHICCDFSHQGGTQYQAIKHHHLQNHDQGCFPFRNAVWGYITLKKNPHKMQIGFYHQVARREHSATTKWLLVYLKIIEGDT